MQKGILRQFIHDSKRGAAAVLFRAVSEFATGKSVQWQLDTKKPVALQIHAQDKGPGCRSKQMQGGLQHERVKRINRWVR